MKILKNNQGLTLFMVIFVMAFFLLFITGSLVFSQLELKKASNLKLAYQSVEVADAGLQHGLAVIPWVWDFNSQLSCGTPPCAVKDANNSPLSNISFPAGSGFSYTVTAQNDPPDTVSPGSPTNDTNNTIVLNSTAYGPSSTSKSVAAYIRRSLAPFAPPAALYVNASSSALIPDSSYSMANSYFDINDSMIISGNDTNSDGSQGPAAAVEGIATTNDAITKALKAAYNPSYHCILGLGASPNACPPGAGSTPSIGTVSDALNVDTIATNFFNQTNTVKYFNGLMTNSTTCPTPTSCQFGTSVAPQITYIKESYATDQTILHGYVTGYGVLVFEGKPIIGENFQFYGLIVHKRANSSSFISIEDSAKVYGGILLGSYDEGDGLGKKARFGVKDFARLYYSSQALATVNTNWGSLLPKPARVFAWLDK